MQPSRPLFTAALCVLSTPALAVCAGNQVEVFGCDVETKAVELCLTPDDESITYRFGPAGAPELELSRDFDEVTMQPWSGIGRYLWDNVTLHNGVFSYRLSWSYDKIDQAVRGDVSVLRGDTELATLMCDTAGERSAYFDFDTLVFAMEAAGYCRSDTSEPLRAGPCA